MPCYEAYACVRRMAVDATTDLQAMRKDYEQALQAAFDRLLQYLSHQPQVEQVILFGSFAEGRRDLLTDLDLIVVMHSSLSFVERTARLYQDLDCPVDMDLLVYTPEEFKNMREGGLVAQALRRGKIVYEKKAA